VNQPVARFEELVAWQKARSLTSQIYRATETGTISRDFGLKDQLRRAAVSIMANIAEGFERGKPTEFHQFLSIAKGSCGELRSHLYVAVDAGYLDKLSFREFNYRSKK
jgi:four helix bundle protein